MQKNTIISLVVVMVLVAGGWYWFSTRDDSTDSVNSGPVAVVNGEEISREDLSAVQAQLGAEQTEQAALDVLISQTLLRQAVAGANINVSDEELNSQLEAIKGQFPTEAEYATALSSQGLTEAALRTQLRQELATQAYLTRELRLDTLTATEAEIAVAYEQAIVGAEDVPPLTEVTDQVRGMVIGQKQQALVAEHIQNLRSRAEIEILI